MARDAQTTVMAGFERRILPLVLRKIFDHTSWIRYLLVKSARCSLLYCVLKAFLTLLFNSELSFALLCRGLRIADSFDGRQVQIWIHCDSADAFIFHCLLACWFALRRLFASLLLWWKVCCESHGVADLRERINCDKTAAVTLWCRLLRTLSRMFRRSVYSWLSCHLDPLDWWRLLFASSLFNFFVRERWRDVNFASIDVLRLVELLGKGLCD